MYSAAIAFATLAAIVRLSEAKPIEITRADIDLIKNSSSKLPIGSRFRRTDLLRLALMASDNRAAAALGRSYPGGLPAFVAAMNAKAATLGLTQTHYVDSSGLSPENVSSPADLAKLVAAASPMPPATLPSSVPPNPWAASHSISSFSRRIMGSRVR